MNCDVSLGYRLGGNKRLEGLSAESDDKRLNFLVPPTLGAVYAGKRWSSPRFTVSAPGRNETHLARDVHAT